MRKTSVTFVFLAFMVFSMSCRVQSVNNQALKYIILGRGQKIRFFLWTSQLLLSAVQEKVFKKFLVLKPFP